MGAFLNMLAESFWVSAAHRSRSRRSFNGAGSPRRLAQHARRRRLAAAGFDEPNLRLVRRLGAQGAADDAQAVGRRRAEGQGADQDPPLVRHAIRAEHAAAGGGRRSPPDRPAHRLA
eukprot:1743212-Prymnesium_polylepis.1